MLFAALDDRMSRVCLQTLQPVGVVACVSSTIQGILWSVLSFLGLLGHFCILNDVRHKTGRMTLHQYILGYIQERECNNPVSLQCADVSSPRIVEVWLWLELILNLLLTLFSIALMIALLKKRKIECFTLLNLWLIVSVLVAALDVVVTFSLGADYLKLQNVTCIADIELAALSVATLLLLASRGIFLWSSNAIFIVFLSTAARDLYYTMKQTTESRVDLISSCPSLNNYGELDLYRTNNSYFVTGVNSRLGPSSMREGRWASHTARSRWPTLSVIQQQPSPFPYSGNRSRPKLNGIYPGNSILRSLSNDGGPKSPDYVMLHDPREVEVDYIEPQTSSNGISTFQNKMYQEHTVKPASARDFSVDIPVPHADSLYPEDRYQEQQHKDLDIHNRLNQNMNQNQRRPSCHDQYQGDQGEMLNKSEPYMEPPYQENIHQEQEPPNQFDTHPALPPTSVNSDNSKNLRHMTLHEAILNRKPLRPINKTDFSVC